MTNWTEFCLYFYKKIFNFVNIQVSNSGDMSHDRNFSPSYIIMRMI